MGRHLRKQDNKILDVLSDAISHDKLHNVLSCNHVASRNLLIRHTIIPIFIVGASSKTALTVSLPRARLQCQDEPPTRQQIIGITISTSHLVNVTRIN